MESLRIREEESQDREKFGRMSAERKNPMLEKEKIKDVVG